jgi:hypothetical protein
LWKKIGPGFGKVHLSVVDLGPHIDKPSKAFPLNPRNLKAGKEGLGGFFPVLSLILSLCLYDSIVGVARYILILYQLSL